VTICRRIVVVLCVCILCGSASAAQGQTPDKLNAKSLEAAASYAESLAQWAFIIVGGSLVLVLGNSHRWPKSRKLRATYFLFLFAWGSLARSIYFGTRVHQVYLAYLLVPSTTVEGTTRSLNDDLGNQIWWMFGGLFFLCLWLLFYLGWSVLSKDVPNVRGDS
jgi:hypothetical protein